MQLVLRQECKPVDTLLLVLAQLRLDRNGDVVLLHLAPVKELCEELPLLLASFEQVLWEVGGIRKASLYMHQLLSHTQRNV